DLLERDLAVQLGVLRDEDLAQTAPRVGPEYAVALTPVGGRCGEWAGHVGAAPGRAGGAGGEVGMGRRVGPFGGGVRGAGGRAGPPGMAEGSKAAETASASPGNRAWYSGAAGSSPARCRSSISRASNSRSKARRSSSSTSPR